MKSGKSLRYSPKFKIEVQIRSVAQALKSCIYTCNLNPKIKLKSTSVKSK